MLLKIPDEYPGKTNYCFKRKYIKEYFSTLRDLSQLTLSTHYTTNVKIVMKKYKSLERLQHFTLLLPRKALQTP